MFVFIVTIIKFLAYCKDPNSFEPLTFILILKVNVYGKGFFKIIIFIVFTTSKQGKWKLTWNTYFKKAQEMKQQKQQKKYMRDIRFFYKS